MPRCPVCQTLYSEGKVENCSLCGWYLPPYSLVLGIVPEVFTKEKARLEWAKNLWATIKPQRSQIQNLQHQLKESLERIPLLQADLAQVQQERDELATTLEQQQIDLAGLRSQFDQTTQDCAHLTQQFEQVQQELHTLRKQLHQIEQERDRLREMASLHQTSVSKSMDASSHFNGSFEPVSAPPEITAPISTQESTFQVVRLDQQGQLAAQWQGRATTFVEQLDNVALELVLIPAGQFMMGSPDDELGRESHEGPTHLVTLSAFWMSRYPITQAQWRAIAKLSPIQRPLNPDPSHFKGEDQPVEQISWYDAIEFCARLSKVTSRDYRLPSEAEWEYACRATSTTPFHFGATLTSGLANYDGNYMYGDGVEGQYRQRTVPVGMFQIANGFGLYDMHGNVWEWCADPWHDTYQDAPTNGRVWEQGGIQTHRLLRGGSWYCLPNLCRAAQRHWDEAAHSGSGIGFRIVCSL
jgi:formylglycine-generating enzyme required for sulfatase activity